MQTQRIIPVRILRPVHIAGACVGLLLSTGCGAEDPAPFHDGSIAPSANGSVVPSPGADGVAASSGSSAGAPTPGVGATPGVGTTGSGDPANGDPANGAAAGGVPGAMDGVTTTVPGGGDDLSCDEPVTPRAPLRRLTRFEYNNTVRDLLGITSSPADDLPGEEAGSGFGNDADALGVSRLLIDGYRGVAQQIAQEVTADASAVTRVAGCDPATGEEQCKQSFLSTYLTRAFRRPPDSEELASYDAAFAQGQSLGGDFTSGVRAVVERSLQSAQFLYRVELGEPADAVGGAARPSGYEMASRLSYLLWGSTPDPVVLDAAAQGSLDTPEGVLGEARRMLDDDKSKDSLRHFHGQLLGTAGLNYLERDTQIYPAFEPGMGALFRQETEHFLDYVIWEGPGDLATIFTAPYTFVNGALATFYGIPDVSGDEFVQAPVDTSQRGGLLTQASILTLTTPGNRTSPVVRGKWLYTKMLCGLIPDPPLNVPKLPEPEPGQSVRERLAQHREDDACKGCHVLMDPLGLAFEHFDGVGQWRDMDNNAAIDTTGEIPTTDAAGPFDGVLEFEQKLAESSDVRGCYVGRYLTYAYGRALDSNDACSRVQAESAFEQAQGRVKDLVLAVTQTDGFLLRPLVVAGQ